jgi:ATP-dependent exoDNAse (exonuclease V) beta subunit
MGSQLPPGAGIKPGLHKPRKGGHRVVWWDAALLDEPSQIKPSIRRDWILRASEGEGTDPGAERYETWRARREALLESGARPSLVVTTATRAAEVELAMLKQEDVRIELVERSPRRPTGKAFGTLVHEVLATTELNADRERVQARAAILGRVFGNTEDEILAASEAVSKALSHPLLIQAAEMAHIEGLCLRETPIMIRNEDGSLIEGVVDLAFRADVDAPWTVVDFKTDARVDMGQQEYRRQVALYTEALERASGAEAHGVLLYV